MFLMLYALNNGWQVCELSGCAFIGNYRDARANNDVADRERRLANSAHFATIEW
jgi:hypothetical protein